VNGELLKNHYLVIPNFIDPKEAKRLEREFHITDEMYEFPGDPQAPHSSSVYNYLPALELLANKTPEVSKIIGETVLPTYVYSRIYRKGDELTKHTDRPACEISMTLHLGGDKPWAIWITTSEGKDRCVNLNPGDAMMYLGCIAPHWRDTFEGTNYTQFFLHYVRSRGMNGEAVFDKIKDLEDDIPQLKKEYDEMRRINLEDMSEKTILPRWMREQVEEQVEEQVDDAIEKVDDVDDFTIVEEKTGTNFINFESDNGAGFMTKDDEEEFYDLDDAVIFNKKYNSLLEKSNAKPVESGKAKEKTGSLSQKSLKDFIMVKEEFVDPDFCDEILEEYARSELWEKTFTGSGLDEEARKCQVITISDQRCINENNDYRREIDDKMFKIVKDIIDEYVKEHPEFDLEISEDSGYELLRYEVGDFYIEHTDSFKEQPRALTIIIAMNNAYEGGEVAMFQRELVHELDVGDILVFPSNFMYPHEILPVTDGTRYSMITWVV